MSENNLTASHTGLCLGGPLDGMRYQARGAHAFLLALRDTEDLEYRAVTVTLRDGPVMFWAPEGMSMVEILQRLLAGVASSDVLPWR